MANWLLSFALGTTTAASGSAGTWQNPGTVRLALGIGSWRVMASLGWQITPAGTEIMTSLGSSASGSLFVNGSTVRDYQTGRSVPSLNSHKHVLNNITFAAAGFVYGLFQSAGNFDARGDAATPHQCYIEAVTNYL